MIIIIYYGDSWTAEAQSPSHTSYAGKQDKYIYSCAQWSMSMYDEDSDERGKMEREITRRSV